MEIDIDYVTSKSVELNDNIDLLRSELKKLITVVGDLSSGWKGEEASEFVKKIDEDYINKMQDLISKIEKYQVFLSKTPGAYQLLDDIYAEKKIEV